MPTGQSDVRAKPRTHFDEVLRRYTNPPSQKKKLKQEAERLQENVELKTLRKNLTKDTEEDETILKNTYDPVQGSPRYTKNRRRENEVFKKDNISDVGKEMSTGISGRKKSKRALPPPPGQAEDDSDKNALRSEIKLPAEAGLGEKRKGKTEKSRRGDDDGVTKAEYEREDDLLQEYQQQITQEEQRALKKTQQKKRSETLQEVIVLNNEFEKKKKKKNLKERKGEESELPSKCQQNQMEIAVDKTKSNEDFQNDLLEEEKEDTVKPIGKKKKKRKQEVTVQDSQTEVDASPSQAFDDSLVLGVYIHRTDRLKTDLLVSHPMVKVYVVDEITGQYVKKEDGHRRVSSFYEQENVEHVLPIITQPFDFKKQKSTVPDWEEQIIFNERFTYFLQQNAEAPKVILFFEILEIMSMEEARENASADMSERGFRKIAWAFLKLVGTNGVLNVGSKLRLQLYSPPPRARKNPQTLEVFQWWSKYPWNRYSSTLYVTVKGLKLPDHVDPSIRSMMALQQERGSTSYTELQTELTQKTFTQLLESKSDAIKWSRLPGQVCRIPNKPMLSFRGGQMGCFALCFSHDGRVLAAACADRDAFPIIVYEIPSGKVLASFNGHLSIVYDLCWTRDGTGLLSASSDGTVRVWNIERLQGLAEKILPHPSFVYSAQYHPQAPSLVVTGGYDGLLRVWNLDFQDVNGQLLQEFEGHKTFINALCFDSEGNRMFSADNAGIIIAWSTKVEGGSWHGAVRLWKIEKEIKESDLNGISISFLQVHPNGRRLLIHAKDSVLRVMDLRIFAIKKYIGATNYRERINSTFTPCGNFIFSGSEDGFAYVWNAETGDQVAVYSELCYPTALRGVAFHPHEHLVAFCAFGQNQPIQLYVFDRKVTQLELESMRVLNRSDTAVSKTLRNPTKILAFQDTSASGMDRFASAARMSLKMQRVKQKLDSVLEPHRNTSGTEYIYDQGSMSQLGRGLSQEGFHTSLPPPSLLSPHSNLQLSSSLGAQLIPQATLSSQTFGSTAFGHPIRRTPSLKQRSLPDHEFSLQVETDVEQVQQTVVTLYDYNANRSDELMLRRGDVIHVLHKDNDNWWFGCLASGHRGYFPAAYVADEKGFDEELSWAIEAQPGPSQQISEGVNEVTATKLSAAVSASGELKIISEQDTDAEAPSVKIKKKKKRVKKSELPYDLPPTTSADIDTSVPSTRKPRPLPRLGQTNSSFKSGTQDRLG
ncbi:jouberin isoform X1 [Neoarius graeffei]|uniref:jouberin isoform X1 n=1 Tax=Neoarius graeffei TaxID=443677 RepID=UPI00298D285B|nr:jouberin isoform X1 [Neoarius graeffei]XP_060790423.1 jouberin isoform X1 [Neoarius graeffei]XP_060790424.1 jouberin isoform X1 [Neoarius graeffei]XP_060790425.1 jouberin isoform X1 [Neoarius graeffei]